MAPTSAPDASARAAFLEGIQIDKVSSTFLLEVQGVGEDAAKVTRRVNALMEVLPPYTDEYLGSSATQLEDARERVTRLRGARDAHRATFSQGSHESG